MYLVYYPLVLIHSQPDVALNHATTDRCLHQSARTFVILVRPFRDLVEPPPVLFQETNINLIIYSKKILFSEFLLHQASPVNESDIA